MADPVNPPRGMRDFLPAEKTRRELALSVIRDVYRSHGFDEIETPVVEEYSRLHAGLGGDNEKLSYSILKRGLSSHDLSQVQGVEGVESLCDLGLRFDLTVPLTRFYASHRAQLPPVFRSVQIAPVWRAERPQKGRYRQFVQADIDIIGEPGLLAEVELIVATSEVLAELGLGPCTIRMNDRRILLALLSHCGFDENAHDRVLIVVDKLDKVGVDNVVEQLSEIDAHAAARLGEVLRAVQPQLAGEGIALTGEGIRAALPESSQWPGVVPLAELGDCLAGALAQGVSVRFDPTLVRGMGYYTATIFEIAHPGSGSSVGGGGRYDGMIGRFIGEQVPAVGFSIGFERVVDLIELDDVLRPDAVVLVYERDAGYAGLLKLKRELVAQGQRVRLERRQKNMKALLSRLLGEGFTRFAMVPAGGCEVDQLDIRRLCDSNSKV